MVLFSFPAIILNIGADIAGMGAVANLIFPSIHAGVFSVLFTGILMGAIVLWPYQKIALSLNISALSCSCTSLSLFLTTQDWKQVLLHTVVPEIHFTKEYVGILVAVLGTTISPYLFFWQATMESEDMKHQKHVVVDKGLINRMRIDVNAGMLFSILSCSL